MEERGSKMQKDPALFLSSKGPTFFLSFRFLLALTAWFAFMNAYQQRINLSLAIICMLNHTHLEQEDISSSAKADPSRSSSQSHVNNLQANISGCATVETSGKTDGKFTWSKGEQGFILGAFFWGYITTQVVGGWMAERYGSKRVFLASTTISSLMTLLTPAAAEHSTLALVLARAFMGVSQGAVFPSSHALWSRWAPPNERTVLTGIVFSGADFGVMFVYPASGALCDAFGWESIFYVSGASGLLGCALWAIVANDIPRQSALISKGERVHIEGALGGHIKAGQELNTSTAWSHIFRSAPVWALMTAHTCGNFGYYLIITMLPTYMNEILRFDIKSNGMLSSLPSMGRILMSLATVVTVDYMRRRAFASTKLLRKVCTFVGLIGFGAFLLVTGYFTCADKHWAIVFIIVGMTICAMNSGGFVANHIDLAPRYGGTLFGITNTLATVPGFVVPMLASALTPDRTVEQWRTVFWLAFGVLTFGAVTFALFAQGETQTWALVPALETGEAAAPAENGVLSLTLTDKEQSTYKKVGIDKELNLRLLNDTNP